MHEIDVFELPIETISFLIILMQLIEHYLGSSERKTHQCDIAVNEVWSTEDLTLILLLYFYNNCPLSTDLSWNHIMASSQLA